MTKNYLRDGRAPIPEKEITSYIMSQIKSKNTKPEIKLRKEMWKNGIRGYRLHWPKVPGRPDIAFPSRKIAIFVNGCYWHRCPNCIPSFPKTNPDFWKLKFEKNRIRDKLKITQLKREKWKVLVIWECKINVDLNDSIKKIKGLLRK